MQILVHIGLLYFVKKNKIVYFDSFGVEHIPEEIKEFIGNKNVKANITSKFIDFILADKKVTDYTNMFPPYDFDKNGSIILSSYDA